MSRLIHHVWIDMMLKQNQMNEGNPCGCRTECDGYPVVVVGMKVVRYLWQGCKNQPTVFLWRQNIRSGNMKGNRKQWRHLFIDKPNLMSLTAPTQPIEAPAMMNDKPDLSNLFGLIKPNLNI